MERKTWVRPEVKRIRLVTEEAVLSACKTPKHMGPGYNNKCVAKHFGACHSNKS